MEKMIYAIQDLYIVLIKMLSFSLVSTCIFTRKSLSDNYWMLVISVYIYIYIYIYINSLNVDQTSEV